jgi:hypothetical protein
MAELASVVRYGGPRGRLLPSLDNGVDGLCGNAWHVAEQHYDAIALAGGIQTCE